MIRQDVFERCSQLAQDAGYAFTLDGAADEDGNNAFLPTYCTRTKDFRKTKLAGHNVWLNAPFACLKSFIQHYLQERQQAPEQTSCMIVVPCWERASWWPLLEDWELVDEFDVGTQLFTAPPLRGQKNRRVLGPTRWPVRIYWAALQRRN